MGDRAFARARAAGKNETEAGHARAKADMAFRVSEHSIGLAKAYGPFLPAVYHPFVPREAG